MQTVVQKPHSVASKLGKRRLPGTVYPNFRAKTVYNKAGVLEA